MPKLTRDEMLEELDVDYSETYEGDEDLDLMTPEEYGEYINNLSLAELKEEYNKELGWMEHRELQ